MKWDFKRELARKAIHFLTIFMLILYFVITDMFSRTIAMLLLVLLLMTALEFEYFRIEVGRKIPIISDLWAYLRRNKEKQTLGGDVFFIIGAIIVLSIFDLKIAASAILMTTFGDMSAALIGKRFGRHKIKWVPKKSWEGVFAELIVDIIVVLAVFAYWEYPLLYLPSTWLITGVMALTATFVETIITKMDDNLFIPIFSGFFGEIVLLLSKSLA